MNFRKASYLLLAGILAVSCATSKKTKSVHDEAPVAPQPSVEQPVADTPVPVSTPAQLAGKRWELKWLKDVDVASVNYSGSKPFVVFDSEKLTVSGHTGCNGFGGNIEVQNGAIKIGMLFATKKFCMDIPEPEFMRYLESCDKYVVVNQTLKLYKSNELLLELTESLQK